MMNAETMRRAIDLEDHAKKLKTQHDTYVLLKRDLGNAMTLENINVGSPSDLYDNALPGWTRVERKALADGARERTEVLWINPAAASNNQDLFTSTANSRGATA